MRCGQPIMPALKGQPAIAALQAVTNTFSFRHRMMCIHHGRYARQGRRTQFTQQAVDIGCNEVEMKVRIHFSEVSRLDVAPAKLRFWVRDTAFEELRRGGGGSRPVDLIDPSASSPWVKWEIAFSIRH